MRKFNDYYVSELEFEDAGMMGPPGKDGDTPSLSVEKVEPFLYRMNSRKLDYDAAEVFVRKYYADPQDDSACAVVANGSLLGHNYDAPYDNTAAFVVRVGAQHGHHGSICMSAIPGLLTADMVDAETETDFVNEAYDVLPFFAVDGMNDAGVAVAVNKMPGSVEHETPSDDTAMCALFAVRYVLDNANSASHAMELLRSKTFWFPKNDQIKFEFYLTIYDKQNSYFVDISGTEITNIQGKPTILTNFRLTGDDPLEPYSNGIERYNILSDRADDIDSPEEMINVLSMVNYTGVYREHDGTHWFSDFNGNWDDLGFGELTTESSPEDYADIIAYFSAKFANRERDGQTKHTMHTAVYDIDAMTMTMVAQEGSKVHRFAIDEMSLISEEIERAKGAETAILEELYDSFYTQDDIDAILEEIVDALEDTIETGLAGKADNPENGGVAGQALFKTAAGSAWGNLPEYLPEVTEDDNGKVMAVEDGAWVLTDKFADYIRYVNVTVSITADNGHVPAGGINVLMYNADTGDMINTARYEGQPVTFRVPRGLRYVIRQTGIWEGYHNPTPDKIESAANSDASYVFTYEAIKQPETLRELEIIVNDGNAASMAAYTGLQFEDVYEENGVEYEVIWDLKHVGTVYDEQGMPHTGVILEWHHATPTAIPFDAPERVQVDLSTETVAAEGVYYYGVSGSTYTMLSLSAGDPLPTTYDALYKNAVRNSDAYIIRRGYAEYAESAPRKWLNSNGNVGAWWTSTHIGDTAPEQANTLPGFMHGCSAQILRMAKPVRIATIQQSGELGYTYDTFFLPSCTEMYGVGSGSGEGVAWQDWIDATGFAGPSNDASTMRRIYAINDGSPQEVGLRSVNTSYKYISWDVQNTGAITGYVNANTPRRYTPCCAIY